MPYVVGIYVNRTDLPAGSECVTIESLFTGNRPTLMHDIMMAICSTYGYVYLLGGAIFAVGLYFAARHGYIGFSGKPRRNLILCFVVLGFFAVLQGYLQYAPMTEAVPKAYEGGAEEVLDTGSVRGQPIDYAIMIGYFIAILIVGTWFGRRQKTTKDFFFGGQRFAWWLIAFSLVATTVGSYSFVKYSRVGYTYGLASSQSYLNDWIWFPLLVFGWLPILYFSRITSIPEYFGRRFGPQVRLWATLYILVYLVGYVGVNLFTMGTVLNTLLGWPIPLSALLIAAVSASYVTVGGQTSVIMTDLLQGIMLLLAGFVVLFLGIEYLGGFSTFWENLPRETRLAFANFNEKPDFPSVGIFWQDAVANSAMFYFLNQGIAMRFLAARSLADSRKAVLVMMLILMPVAACVVASGGWVARALVNAGALPQDVEPDKAFFVASELLCRPGVFGLILAALTAALMSTVDTLITAVSAITVNDLYRPYINPAADERRLLRAARICAVSVTVLGVLLVPVFMRFNSIYAAHGAFTAAVTPPLVVVLLMSVFCRRFTRTAAIATLVGGMIAIIASLVYPQLVKPFAFGVPMQDPEGSGILWGMKQLKFMRAFYGLSVSTVIAVVVMWFTRPEPFARQKGLVWGTIADALRHYKGSSGVETQSRRATAQVRMMEVEPDLVGEGQLPVVDLSAVLARTIEAMPGDLVYISDTRSWLGGLRSTQAIVGQTEAESDEPTVWLGPQTFETVVTPSRKDRPLCVERLY